MNILFYLQKDVLAADREVEVQFVQEVEVEDDQ